VFASNDTVVSDDAKDSDKKSGYNSGELDGFLNLKTSHERSNENVLGSKNCSAVGLNPVIFYRNFRIENDFYYGRQFSCTGFLTGERNLSKITSNDKRNLFHKGFSKIKSTFSKGANDNINKAHLYRNYSRAVYENNKNNFKVVVGDTSTRNQIGFQQALSGFGVSVFRQSGNGSVINKSSPIVITRLSKVECRLGSEILSVRLFAPGIYSIEDLPEEAKLPGVTIKISDQLNRSDVLKANYFGNHELLDEGKDDFDATMVLSHRWNIDDPHKVKYANSPRLSSNYRYGYNGNITLGGGAQYHSKDFSSDCIATVLTKFGLFSTNVSFSHANDNDCKSNAFGAGVYCANSSNKLLSFEMFACVKEKGFGDLGLKKDQANEYNKMMRKYFDNSICDKFKYTVSNDSSRQIITRIYTKSFCGVVPSFVFSGEWSKSQRLREYTVALTTKLFDKCMITVSAGITYDDPSKGSNLESPDRRLTIAGTIPIGSDFSVAGSYFHHDEERLRGYEKIQYNPSEIKGLEIVAERCHRPNFDSPSASIKYDGEYFDIKAEEKISNTYGSKKQHNNQQRLFFGTSIHPGGISSYKKSSFNVLR
jgi:outer membrane usher protein FimD/PapC